MPSTSLRATWLSGTIAFALCLAAALIGIEVWQMWHAREASLHSSKIVTASLAESLSQQIETTLKTADTVVASLVQRAEVEGLNVESRQRLYGLMTSLAAALPAIHEMGMTDKDGNAIIKSLVPNPVGMNYSERDYFRFLRDHDTRDVFIGTPVKSKVDGSINITVSRRINARDGSFAGVVVTSVSMEFFRKMFKSVQAESGGLISLVADNGTVLATSPDSFGDGELEALAASPAGALEYLSPRDRVHRVGSYNRLAHYPMIAVVAEDSSAILDEWRRQVKVHIAIVLSILLVIGVLGYRVDQANRAARTQALRDGLTGLANRRCFNQAIEAEFRRAARNGQPLSLIMVDIDHFKSFNDQYGHPAGDACLRAVSAAVQGVLRRPGDMAARYGGEEIAILLPGTLVAGAARIASDMRVAVQSLAIPHKGSPHGVLTLSAGVASCCAERRTTTWAALVEAADAALYAAKALGRNTYTVDPNAETAAPAPPIAQNHAA
jgi:diguanylate cyclase (GGDEF)-like protein